MPTSPPAVTLGLSSATYSVNESDEVANVSLELTKAAEKEVTVHIETSDRTATGRESDGSWWHVSCSLLPLALRDYSAVSQEVMFPAGTTQRSVAIPIMEDSVLEAMEFFTVEVTVPASYAALVLLGTDTAIINVTDDDSELLHWSTQYS